LIASTNALIAQTPATPASLEALGPPPGTPVPLWPPWYPRGPYGTDIGDTMANLAFAGKTDANGNGTPVDDPMTTIFLSDYQRHALTHSKVLMLSLCAVWCVPCQIEEPQLVAMWKNYEAAVPGAVKFASVMAQDAGFRDPTESVINFWARRFQVPWDMLIDPQGVQLFPYSPEEAFPFHLVIRTRDMQITAKILGFDLPSVQAAIDNILSEPDQQ
jgi:hypothetical protein